MADAFIRIAQDSNGKRVDNTAFERSGETIYRQRVETHGNPSNIDTSGRTRTSNLITLFDGKIMNAEDAFRWDTQGTGTSAYASNAVNLSVTAGQYLIRQSRFFSPYFSGKSQLVEITQQNFQHEHGVTKRVGYFSSSAVAPYDSNYDGWWIESNGTSYYLVTSNNGTETHRVEWVDWDGYSKVSGYDWSKFTVCLVDFLWLGGAGLRFFMVINGKFELIHTIGNHAGYKDSLMMLSPNQPVRYEIRSSTGSGSMLSICSQVATEGAGPNEQGEGISWYSPPVSANNVGTVYALCGAKKQTAYRNHFCQVSEIGVGVITADSGILMLLLNPTLSAPLTYSNNSRIQSGVAGSSITVSNVGRILKSVPIVSAGVNVQAPAALLRNLPIGIGNTPGELVVAYAPQTANQTVFGTMQVMEY